MPSRRDEVVASGVTYTASLKTKEDSGVGLKRVKARGTTGVQGRGGQGGRVCVQAPHLPGQHHTEMLQLMVRANRICYVAFRISPHIKIIIAVIQKSQVPHFCRFLSSAL